MALLKKNTEYDDSNDSLAETRIKWPGGGQAWLLGLFLIFE